MNKQEALKRIENAEKEIALAKAELNKTTELDMVPDNIQIEKNCGGGDTLGIRFKDHILYYWSNTWNASARTATAYNREIIPCRLVKIDRKDILNGKYKGDTVFFTQGDDTSSKDNLTQYGKVVKDQLIYISNDMPCSCLIDYWKNYYKITPVED